MLNSPRRRWRSYLVMGCVAAVAASSLPLLWRTRQNARDAAALDAAITAKSSLPPASAVASGDIIVDLRDDATPSDISQINAHFGLNLRPNSIEARKNKLMRAAVPPGTDPQTLLKNLRQDPRVEAAEPDLRFDVPETPALTSRATDSTASVERAATLNNTATPNGAVTVDSVPATENTTSESAIPATSEAEKATPDSDQTDAPATSPVAPAAEKASAKWHGWKPNDPRLSEQWNLRMIGAGEAWDRSRGKGIVVAVIDTGVAGKSTSRGKRARDFNKTKFVAGYDFVHDDDDPYDDQGHGTHVAGTIAESTNNKEGVAGIAFEASIMPIKVLSASGFGTSADVADGIRFAADNGANIINLSLGSPAPSEVVEDAVKYAQKKGVLLVCAAGNGFGEGVGYPAAFPGCLAVSAVGPSGELAVYSSFGKEVSLAAPGGDLFTDENGGILQNTIWPEGEGGEGDGYYQFQGTSMATPHVAGVAALIMAQGIKDPGRVRDILLRSATPRGPRAQYGSGILSADKATATGVRQHWAGWIKELIWSGLALPLLWYRRGSRSSSLSAFMAGAFWLGAFGPDWVANYVGANSLLNLLAFSALLPFILFWELEDRKGSMVVMSLSLGSALCLVGSLWGGVLSPFTATALGWTVLPWTVANLCAVSLLALVTWSRGKAKA